MQILINQVTTTTANNSPASPVGCSSFEMLTNEW